MKRLVDLVLRHPGALVCLYFVLGVYAAVVHGRGASYDFSFNSMAPTETIQFRRAQEFKEHFGESDELFLVVFTDDPLLTNENLAVIDRVTHAIEALDHTDSVLSLTNAKDIQGTDDGLDVPLFIDPESLPVTQDELRRLAARVVDDPITSGTVISADGKTAALIGRLIGWAEDPIVRIEYFDEVHEILDREGGGHEFHISGVPYLDRALMSHIQSDTVRFLPLTAVGFGLLLWLAFGQLRATWMTIVPVIIAGLVAVGAITWSGESMTLLTSEGLLINLITVIGLSDCVHLLNRYAEDVTRSAASTLGERMAALRTSMSHIGVACFLTSATTAVGFVSLTLSGIPTIRQFGAAGALGIGMAYVAAVIVLPALIVLMEGWKLGPIRAPGRHDLLDSILDRVVDSLLAKPKLYIGTVVAVLVFAALSILNVRIDNRFTQDLKANDPAVLALNFVEDHMGAAFPLEIVAEGDGPNQAKNPAVLAGLDAVGRDLVKLPQIHTVVSPAEFIQKMNRAMNEDDPRYETLPDSQDLIAQYLLLFELAGGDNEFDRLVNYDYSQARMTLMMKDGPPAKFYEVVEALNASAEGRFPENVSVHVSGDQPLLYTVTERLIKTLLRSLYFAMPVIFLITGLAFRSVRMGLLSVLPNVFPITVGMGALGLLGMPLRFSTIVAFPIAFGLAIDDTIHFLTRYRSERAAGLSVDDAIRRTIRTAGRAMVLTTVFLLVGYAVMFTSNFRAMMHMSGTVIVILAAALFGDLLALPALLKVFDSDGQVVGADQRAETV